MKKNVVVFIFLLVCPAAILVNEPWQMAYKPSEWNGPTDLSGTFYLGWDEKYLYTAAKVIDELQ